MPAHLTPEPLRDDALPFLQGGVTQVCILVEDLDRTVDD